MNQYLFTFFCAIVCIQSACKEKISKDQTYIIIIKSSKPIQLFAIQICDWTSQKFEACPQMSNGLWRSSAGCGWSYVYEDPWPELDSRFLHILSQSARLNCVMQLRSVQKLSHMQSLGRDMWYDWIRLVTHLKSWSKTHMCSLINMPGYLVQHERAHSHVFTLWCKTLLLEPRYVVIVQVLGLLS